jgi:hypothetical protein
MKRRQKVVILCVAFLLPISIFLFLKIFGRNQFDVTPLYPEGITVTDKDCPVQAPGQYYIPQHILNGLDWSLKDSLTIYFFSDAPDEDDAALNRLSENIESGEVKLISVNSRMGQGPDQIQRIQIPDDSLLRWNRCFLLVRKPDDLLMVDNKRRIRGYYQLNSREELDSLIMETKIILQKY